MTFYSANRWTEIYPVRFGYVLGLIVALLPMAGLSLLVSCGDADSQCRSSDSCGGHPNTAGGAAEQILDAVLNPIVSAAAQNDMNRCVGAMAAAITGTQTVVKG